MASVRSWRGVVHMRRPGAIGICETLSTLNVTDEGRLMRARQNFSRGFTDRATIVSPSSAAVDKSGNIRLIEHIPYEDAEDLDSGGIRLDQNAPRTLMASRNVDRSAVA